jgi:hypothetical protein
MNDYDCTMDFPYLCKLLSKEIIDGKTLQRAR